MRILNRVEQEARITDPAQLPETEKDEDSDEEQDTYDDFHFRKLEVYVRDGTQTLVAQTEQRHANMLSHVKQGK